MIDKIKKHIKEKGVYIPIPVTAIKKLFEKKVKKTEPEDAIDAALKEYEALNEK
jgi:hypothetical protein